MIHHMLRVATSRTFKSRVSDLRNSARSRSVQGRTSISQLGG
jgi:hypothetical protein